MSYRFDLCYGLYSYQLYCTIHVALNQRVMIPPLSNTIIVLQSWLRDNLSYCFLHMLLNLQMHYVQDKVFVGLDNTLPEFNLKEKLQGPGVYTKQDINVVCLVLGRLKAISKVLQMLLNNNLFLN